MKRRRSHTAAQSLKKTLLVTASPVRPKPPAKHSPPDGRPALQEVHYVKERRAQCQFTSSVIAKLLFKPEPTVGLGLMQSVSTKTEMMQI